jgi:hypothetical protein
MNVKRQISSGSLKGMHTICHPKWKRCPFGSKSLGLIRCSRAISVPWLVLMDPFVERPSKEEGSAPRSSFTELDPALGKVPEFLVEGLPAVISMLSMLVYGASDDWWTISFDVGSRCRSLGMMAVTI